MVRAALALVMVAIIAGCATAPGTASGPVAEPTLSSALALRDGEPQLTITGPADNATVTSPLVLSLDVENLTLSPAGETQDGEGHLHVFLDQDCMQPGLIIPDEEHILHVPDEALIVTIDLDPGRHDLCVQIGDGFHVAVAVQDRISVTVVDRSARTALRQP